MGQLDGKVAVITGAARGIGAGIAGRFADEGAKVALLDSDGPGVQSMAASIGNEAIGYPCDIGDEKSVNTVIGKANGAFGRIDIVVNNAAAASIRAQITEMSLAQWDAVLRVSLTGAFLVCRAVLPFMVRAGGGIIINVASQLGSVAIPRNAAYCTAKGGILQLTRALALDHARDGIRVNSLSPGAVLTPRISELFDSDEAAETTLAALHPIGRTGRPEEIAGAALFLASPDSTFMTGADLVVDGGYTAQ